MKFAFLWFCFAMLSFQLFAQVPAKVKFSDLDVLKGDVFTGTVTLNNQDNGTTQTLPVQLTVNTAAKEKNTWDFSYEFPEKAENNETQSLKLVSGGRYLNDQQVATRTVNEAGLVKIIAEEVDDNRFLVYRYLIGPNSFQLKVVEKVNDGTFVPVKVIDLKR